MRVSDIFSDQNPPTVKTDAKIRAIILEISSKRLGATAVLNESGQLVGIITDGDLRRMLANNNNVEEVTAKEIMSPNPKTIEKDEMAINAFSMMEQNKITQLVVTADGNYAGMIHLHDILKEGVV